MIDIIVVVVVDVMVVVVHVEGVALVLVVVPSSHHPRSVPQRDTAQTMLSFVLSFLLLTFSINEMSQKPRL